LCSKLIEQVEAFSHGRRARDILDGAGVENDIGRLKGLVVCDAAEDGEEKADLLDDELVTIDVDTVEVVEGMLDKDEDTGIKDFLDRGGEEP
jgi:hypothetical protein